MYLNPDVVGQSSQMKKWELDCPNRDGAALIFANYAKETTGGERKSSGIV